MSDKNPTEEAWRITDREGHTLGYGFSIRPLAACLGDKHAQGHRLSELRILFGKDAESQS